jgi:hypothetical protein
MQIHDYTIFPEYPDWVQAFKNVSRQNLLGCPDFSERAARHEDWWNCRNSRPLLLAKGLPAGNLPVSRNFENLANPAEWVQFKLKELERVYFLADALPYIHLDMGSCVLAGLLGAEVSYSANQAWIHPTFSAWKNQPEWILHRDNKLRSQIDQILSVLLPVLSGRALLMSPNLGSAADALMNLMGTENICQSLIDRGNFVQSALAKIANVWRETYSNLMHKTVQYQVGMLHWCELWSDNPYLILESELSALVSTGHFAEFLLPDILRQAHTVNRAIFHICGEESLRHLDAILEQPEISAIQYVPGKGKKAINKLAYLQKIQKRGLPLQIAVSPEEPRELLKVLDPAGLCFLVLDVLSMEELTDFIRLVP